MTQTIENIGSYNHFVNYGDVEANRDTVEQYSELLNRFRLGLAAVKGVSPEELHQTSL